MLSLDHKDIIFHELCIPDDHHQSHLRNCVYEHVSHAPSQMNHQMMSSRDL